MSKAFEFAYQERLRLPIGILKPGEFRKLAQHVGFDLGWIFSGLPYPQKLVGTSCGGITAVLMAMVAKYYRESPAAGEKAADRVVDIIENLRMWNIFTMPATVAKPLIASVATDLLSLVPETVATERWRTAARLLRAGASVGAEVYLVEEILRSPAIFSTRPLLNLFVSKIDREAVFKSPIEVVIGTTDCRTGKARFYSLWDPENQFPERASKLLLESTRLTGEFPDYNVDGIVQADGEIASNFGIEQFCHWRDRYGAVFFAPYTLEGDWPKGPTNFINDISRGFSMQVYRHMRRKMKRYRRILSKDRRNRLPKLYTVLTKEAIQPLVFSSFTTKAMRAGIDQGFRILQENLPGIMRTLLPLWVPS